jgi:hypothetical protein
MKNIACLCAQVAYLTETKPAASEKRMYVIIFIYLFNFTGQKHMYWTERGIKNCSCGRL